MSGKQHAAEELRLLDADYWRAENKDGDVAWVSPYTMGWQHSHESALEELAEMEAKSRD